MKLRVLFSLLLITVAGLGGGCSTITPKTAALQQIHRTYEEDFAVFVLPAPERPATSVVPADSPAFVRTLQAIRAYRINYADTSPAEKAHLKVLEGMIYIQSGRLGLASAVAKDVQAASADLASATGKAVRDQLFAENFDALVSGWTEIREKEDGKSATIAEWKKLEAAAESIRQNLEKRSAVTFADADADQGALYLANTAAIFYVWAFSVRSEEIAPTDAPATRELNADAHRWLSTGRNLIGRFLTEAEKDPAAAQDLGEAPGRLRYVSWYAWLGTKLKSLPASP